MKAKFEKSKKIWRILLCLMPNVASGYLVYLIITSGLAPAKYLTLLIAIIVVPNLLLDITIIRRKKKKKAGRIMVALFFLVVSTLAGAGIYFMNKGISALNSISASQDSIIKVSVIVLKDGPIQTPGQIKNLPISSVAGLDDSYINKVKVDLEASEVVSVESYPALASGLYDDSHDIIIFNESYRNLVESVFTSFEADTRIIKQYEFKNPKSDSKVALVNANNPFNIYVSGVDTKDSFGTDGLSDTNIVATVDPINRKLLLTNIPRDSYVPIALGGQDKKDKLTHAGIYGIDSSVATIENLLDIKIDGYIRVNFTALIDMVDVLGGVDVDNPVGFRAGTGEVFPQGINHLNGKQALAYSRERRNLSNGDNDRGKNQERVLVAILNKLSHKENLTNYQNILSVLGNSLETNVSPDSIAQLVNKQLDRGGNWSVDMNNLTGKPAMGLKSQAMPGSYLYFTELDDDSISSAKSKINEIIKSN